MQCQRIYSFSYIEVFFRDKKCDNIFNYYAAGWNRDGLAGELVKSFDMNPGWLTGTFVIILTDAAPNDSQRILPSQDSPFGHDYSDDISVLMMQPMRYVHCVIKEYMYQLFLWEMMRLLNSAEKKIYRKEFTRIRRIDELAKAAGRLIQKRFSR